MTFLVSKFLIPYCVNYKKDLYSIKVSNKQISTNPLKLSEKLFFLYTAKIPMYSDYIAYQQFNLYYLRSIFNINLIEKNLNAVDTLPKKLAKKILFKTRYKHFKAFNIKYFNETAYMFLISIWLKNPKNVCKFIKKKLDSVHFKQHRRYFLFFFKILNRYIIPNAKLLQIKGLTLRFKGKLGRGGNARKQTKFYHKGYYSLSNKFLALNYNSWDVWTKTGTIGCVFRIFYNAYDLLFNSLYHDLHINVISAAVLIKNHLC